MTRDELLDITRQLKKYLKETDPHISLNMKENEKIHPGKEAEMKKLRAQVAACKKCSLGFSRLNSVFGVGSLEAEVMLVGEGPGYQEDHTGEPFVGRAGQLLDRILASIGLSREKVYITNIVKCHAMINPENPDLRGNDRPPSPQEISACRGYLMEQIKIIRPKCLLLLGSVAARVILGESRGISALRGKWHDFPGDLFLNFNLKVLPTYHPAALLRNPNLKKETWHDMKMLKKFLKI